MSHIKDIIYELKSGITFSPHCFLPMIITDMENSKDILRGHITLTPMVDIEEQEQLFSKLRDAVDSITTNIDNGYICDTSDLKALSLSLYPLEYEESGYKRLNPKFNGIGDVSVIILSPPLFLQALGWGISTVFPHLRTLEVATAQYKEKSYELESWDLFSRPKKERWKKEIFAMARTRPGINEIDVHVASEPVCFDIGDMSEIAICVPVKDLIRGKIPKRLMQADVIELLKASMPVMTEVQGYVFSAGGNIMDIEPTNEWIGRLKNIMPDTEWKCNTIIDKLVADGAAKPRIVFHSVSGDSVFIGINRIEVRFVFFEEKQKQLLKMFISSIEEWTKTKFCHMQVEVNANLGTVKEAQIMKMASFQESKSYVVNNLEIFHRIEADYNQKTSIIGVPACQRAWHYTIQIRTPWNEHFLWYDAETVLDFWRKAELYSKETIQKLMRGNVYARYKKI